MRKKHIIACASLVASFMLAVTAVSNAFALYSKGASDVEFNIGEQSKSGYYLVGSGSFVSGSDWSTTGGVQMYEHEGDKGMLKHQYLTAGDVFKITDGTDDGWYGWNDNASGTDETNFAHTSLQNSAGTKFRLYFNVKDMDWWNRNASHTYAYVFNSITKASIASWPGLLMTRDGTSNYYYVDVDTNGGSYDHVVFNSQLGSDDNQTWDMSLTDMITQNCYWGDNNFTKDDSDGKWKFGANLGFTVDYNANIRVQTSGYYDIYLNNDSNIYICAAS